MKTTYSTDGEVFSHNDIGEALECLWNDGELEALSWQLPGMSMGFSSALGKARRLLTHLGAQS